MRRLRDADIRAALRKSVLAPYYADPNTVVVEELGVLRGAVRVDVAVVDGRLHAYEIKSEADTLERLPRQAELYSQVFDHVTIIVPQRKVNTVVGIVPPWWEILCPVIFGTNRSIRFQVARAGLANPAVNPRALAELLWRHEVLDILAARGAAVGFRSKPRHVLWDRLCEICTLEEIREAVRDRLRQRSLMRLGSPSTLGGAPSQSSAM